MSASANAKAAETRLRSRVARLIAQSMCEGMSDAAETVDRSWPNYLPLATTIISAVRSAPR